MSRVLVHFSCGAASATAASYAVEKYPDCELIYCNTLKYEHPDNERFLYEISNWLDKDIKILNSEKYADIYDVFDKTGWLIGPAGARCTQELKRNVRKKYQRDDDIHILGLTYDEQERMALFEDNNPELKIDWVLDDNKVTKNDCYRIIKDTGIELPMMYKLGYNNNNCIGCVKGGMGYWNKIRRDFPEHFDKMAKQERKMNVAICKRYEGKKRIRVFLDELDPNAGRDVPMPDIECGVLCVNENTREEAQEQFEMRFGS